MKLRFRSFFIAIFLTAGTYLNAQQAASPAYLSEEDLYNEDLSSSPVISDPFESVNRWTFKFNDYVYIKILKPVANTYQKVTPDAVEEGALNFFNNLQYPVRLAGNVLQARWQGAWVETKRFAVNSTVGIAGINRPADSMEGFELIPPEDIGQAFGAWGFSEGPYLVLPLLGPSNLRDLGGLIADRAVNPLNQPFSIIDHWSWENRLGLGVTEFIVRSPTILERYYEMKGSAIDPYSSLKNAYTQYRQGEIAK
jgi:phospholipid-binding lipoprotein MlaA